MLAFTKEASFGFYHPVSNSRFTPITQDVRKLLRLSHLAYKNAWKRKEEEKKKREEAREVKKCLTRHMEERKANTKGGVS